MSQNADKTGSAEKFHLLQPLRDLQSNWEVDVAKILEDYLLKICSGEITGEDDGSFSLNFAEAALLIQNSIQVYSRKVEYLYSLVLHALEFINQQSSHSNQPEEDSETIDHSAPDKEGGHRSAPDDQDDLFWASDDIPVEANITLDNAACCTSDDFVKPPADLLVLEGDCLDASGEGGELESYLLAKCDLYRGFILLDPCDAADVDDFLNKDRKTVNKKKNASRGSSRRSKSRKSFLSPTRQQGGSALKSQNPNLDQSPGPDHGFNFKINDDDVPQNNDSDFNMDGGGYQEFGSVDESDDDSDDDDIWKPLNPHEPGNLKIKPFKKVKARAIDWSKSSKSVPITKEFPVAPLHGPINSDLTQIWESLNHFSDNQQLESPPLYEKLRQSLDLGEQLRQPPGLSGNEIPGEFEPKNDDDNGYDSENANFGPSDFDIPENTYMAEDHDDAGAAFPTDNAFENDDPTPDANLEDLCRRHLDNLLANIGEMEQQTELAVRVSTWKQRIEQNLEEQESLPPFDIHDYGEKVLEKLSAVTEGETTMSFTDVVKGQEKHDVARSFSALLQLVNNGNVDLLRAEDGNHDLRCYTGKKPFHIKLRRHVKRRQEVQLRSSKKKAKSPTNNVEAQVGKGKSSR